MVNHGFESTDWSALKGPAMAAGPLKVGDLGYSTVETFQDESGGFQERLPLPTCHGSTPK